MRLGWVRLRLGLCLVQVRFSKNIETKTKTMLKPNLREVAAGGLSLLKFRGFA